MSLLDKTIRSYIIQYHIEIKKRGYATVYRIQPSQHQDKVYRHYFCDLQYRMCDWDVCQRLSCLDCKKLSTCTLFRARYERKKEKIQDTRYTEAYELAIQKETQQMTDEMIEAKALQIRSKFTDEFKHISVNDMLVYLADEYDIRMGKTKAYQLKRSLEIHFPELFTPKV
jgi:hypothetical protein